LERRKRIYNICRHFDILIVEDDPYYFLQMATSEPFLDSLVPSYIRIDVDGRVLRCDSFSKVIAPGSRAGWITASPKFIERLTRHAEVSTQATCGWAQSFIAKLLVDEWGMEGWIRWLQGLGIEYRKRRDYMVDAITREFEMKQIEQDDFVVLEKDKLISFEIPTAGMFLWIRIAIEKHPLYDGTNAVELMDILWERLAVQEDVLVGPGRLFAATDGQVEEAAKYLRISFSSGEQSDVDEMALRFGRAIRWFLQGTSDE
jgi:aromatic amino acid aminotransferase I / 2-aminoadipate transaminase